MDDKESDEITMIYSLSINQNHLKILGTEFVNNNKSNCSLIINGKNMQLLIN